MVRRVLTFPHAMLKRVCEPAPMQRSLSVANDLVDTMTAHPGCVGLAASQIGVPIRVAVVDVSGHRLTTSSSGLVIMVESEIAEQSGRHRAREGCLSLPDITADVDRAVRIRVRSPYRPDLWSDGFEARAIQHELDHLNGVLILDRVTSLQAVHPRLPSNRRGG